MTIPKDPFILLSYVNTLLRDNYSSLELLCEDRELDPVEIESALAAIGCRYDPAENRFR